MPRGIDHLVLCVNDLKKARIIYETMGFTMTPQAQHPFGTGNTLAQLDGCFLEVLAVTRPQDITQAQGNHFSFAAFNQDFLAQREGMSMLVLDSRDEETDRAEFLGKNLHVYEPFDFQRLSKLPSGEDVTVGFSLTFVGCPELEKLAFFTCKQWRPDLFWKAEYQRHSNGALSIADVFIVAPHTHKPAEFLSAFADCTWEDAGPGTLQVQTKRGNISVLTPKAFSARFPDAFDTSSMTEPFFAGFEIRVEDIGATEALWSRNDIPFQSHEDATWLAPDQGMGCVISLCT